MKRMAVWVCGVVMLSGLLVGLVSHRVNAEPKGKSVTVTGELVDMWCYFEDGSKGAAHKSCATMCAKAGNPIGLLQKNGQVWVVAGMKDHQPAKDIVADQMSETVTLKGTLVSKGGVNMLYVRSVTPAKK